MHTATKTCCYYLSLVPLQCQSSIFSFHVLRQTLVWNMPDHHVAILRAGCNLVVIKRVPNDIEDQTLVACDLGIVDIKPAHL